MTACRAGSAPRLSLGVRAQRAVSAAFALVGAAVVLGGLLGRGTSADDRQPIPPRVFFPDPDPPARGQIDDLIQNSFADSNKAAGARDALVRRFGLWAIPPALDRVRSGNNEPIVLNCLLTIATMRREKGASQHLWPAIPVLIATLRRESTDPWRRVFAALALGTFYGPDNARRGPASREGTEAGAAAAKRALVEANEALVVALGDANGEVSAAASLALMKIGGMSVAHARANRPSPPPATPIANIANVLAPGLLPGNDDVFLAKSLTDSDEKIRAAAALAVACWAISEGADLPTGALAADVARRALNLDTSLRPSTNTQIRAGADGAEALFARGALALLSGRMETWDEIYDVVTTTTERPLVVAGSQILLFAPTQAATHGKLAEFLTLQNVGRGVHREPLIAAALMIAASDGTERGIEAVRQFLRDASREPRSHSVEYDVRFHGAIGILRALLAGRIPLERRETAIHALGDAWQKALAGPDDSRSEAAKEARPLPFRWVLREISKPLDAALQSNPDARPTREQIESLEATFVDPDALTAHDAIDLAVARLNHAMFEMYGLNNLPPRVLVDPSTKVRTPNKEKQEEWLLREWLERYPYFTRLDLLRERGREAAPPAAALRDDVEMDKGLPR